MLDKTAFRSLVTPPIWQQVFPSPRIGLPLLGTSSTPAIPFTAPPVPSAPDAIVFDRVKETSTTGGTRALALLGAATGFQSFAASVGDGNSTFVGIVDTSSQWEVTAAVYSLAGSALTRSLYPYSSSNTFTGTITSTTGAGVSLVVTSNAHGLAVGQWVLIQGVVGNTAANGHWEVTSVTADTFTMSWAIGSGTYVSGGTWTAYRPVNFTGTQTVWVDHPADWLAGSGGILRTTDTLVMSNVTPIAGQGFGPVGDLTRLLVLGRSLTAHPVNQNPLVTVQHRIAGSGLLSQQRQCIYASIRDDSTVVTVSITNCVNIGGLIRVTAPNHTFVTGATVLVWNVTGTTEANGLWTLTVIDPNNFDLQGSTFTNAYVSGGSVSNRAVGYAVHATVIPNPGNPRTGTGPATVHQDDIDGYVLGNTSAGVQATDGFYIAHSTQFGDQTSGTFEWTTGFTIDANCQLALRLNGHNGTAIDISLATNDSFDIKARYWAVDQAGDFGLNIQAPLFGLHQIGGSIYQQALATPAAPTTAVGGGTPAGATDFYFVVAEDRAPTGNNLRTLTSAASSSAARGSSAANWRKITWTAVAGAVKYYILVSTTSTPGSNTVLALTGTWTPNIITGVTITAGGAGGSNGTFTDGTFGGGGGTDGTFAYTIAAGVVTNICILQTGNSYTSQPTFNMPSKGALTGFVATANISAKTIGGGTFLEADDSGQAINGTLTLPPRNNTADITADGNLVTSGAAIVVGTMGVTTTAVSSTTTAETKSLVGTITGTFTCLANFMVPGRKLRFSGHGNLTTGGTASTIDFQFFFAGTKIASTTALAPTISQSNRYFEWELEITCVTAGATGTFFCQGRVLIMNAAAPAAPTVWPILGNNATPPAAVTVDTTASSLVDFKTVTGNNLHTITNNPGTSLEVMN